MDAFLTNGSRSLSKLIILVENMDIFNHWKPLSKAATKVVDDYIQKHEEVDEQFKADLQGWYNKN